MHQLEPISKRFQFSSPLFRLLPAWWPLLVSLEVKCVLYSFAFTSSCFTSATLLWLGPKIRSKASLASSKRVIASSYSGGSLLSKMTAK